MKYITIVYAYLICLIFGILAFVISVILFPLLLFVEMFTLIKEMFTNDGWEHNIWPKFVQGLFERIKEVYDKITEGETE